MRIIRCESWLAMTATLLTLGILSSVTFALPVAVGKNIKPAWWDQEATRNENPELVDEKNNQTGEEGADGEPDDWDMEGTWFPDPGDPDRWVLGSFGALPTGKTGSMSQDVENEFQERFIKLLAIRIRGQGDPDDQSDADYGPLKIEISYTKKNAVLPTTRYQYTRLPDSDVQDKWVTFKLDYQPESETVKISSGTVKGVSVPSLIDEVEVRTKCEPRCKKNVRRGMPAAADVGSSTMTYDPDAQVLSFSDCLIDTLNLDGSGTNDPAFASDPIMGATISIGDFQFLEADSDGYWFEGGTFQISRDNDVFLRAEIPLLWIDDEAKATCEDNIYGEFANIEADLELGSAWLAAYVDGIENSPFWAEFRACTADDVEGWFGDGVTALQTTTADVYAASCTPEPGTVILMATGFAGGLTWLRRRRQSHQPF